MSRDPSSPDRDGPSGGIDYYIVAQVENPASYMFVAVVAAIPVIVAEGAPKPESLSATFTTRSGAEASRDAMIEELRSRLAWRGDRVASVERDRPPSAPPPPEWR